MATEYLTVKHTASKTVYLRFISPSDDKVWDFGATPDAWAANVAACVEPKLSATAKTDYGDADESYYIASYDMTSVNSTATPKQILIQAVDDLATDEIITEAEAWVVNGVLLTRSDVVRIEGADPSNTINAAADAALTDYAAPTKAQMDSAHALLATPAQVNAQVVDVLNVDTFAQPGQEAPAATTTLTLMLRYLYKFLRNKRTQTATTETVYADNETTTDHVRTISDDGTTFTHGELKTGA